MKIPATKHPAPTTPEVPSEYLAMAAAHMLRIGRPITNQQPDAAPTPQVPNAPNQ